MTECPYCGNQNIMEFSSYEHLLRDGKNHFPEIATVDGPIEVSQNPSKSLAFLKCVNCNMEYVNVSLEIDPFLNELTIKDYIVPLMNHHYSQDVTITDLIKNYRTGVIKKPKYFETNLPNSEKKRQIIVCFNYNGIRTFGTFIREIRSKTKYEMTGLGRLKL